MNWKKVTGYRNPQEEEVGKTTAYLRRNIEEIEDKEGNTAWSYEECQMSLTQYEEYKKEINSPAMQVLLDRIAKQEESAAESLLMQMEILNNQSAQDETLAGILLDGVKGE